MAHRFLSEGWFDAVEALRDEAPEPPDVVKSLAVNIVVYGGPDGDVKGHLAAGQVERGLADNAPTSISIPYAVARKLFIEADAAAAINALLAGEIKIEGDPAPLLPLQLSLSSPTTEQLAFQQKLQSLTA